MKRFLLVVTVLVVFALPSQAFAASKWQTVFTSGVDTNLDFDKLQELSSSGDYAVVNGDKRYEMKSIFVRNWKLLSDDFPLSEVFFYSDYNANGGKNIFGLHKNAKGEIEITSNGEVGVAVNESFKIQRKDLNLMEIVTSGKVEVLETAEGEGVQEVYTTPWKREFIKIQSSLVRMETVQLNGDKELRKFVFSYKKGGYGNYDQCIKNKAMPFCFKKDGKNLVMFSRGQLGDMVSFFFKNPKAALTDVTCAAGTSTFSSEELGIKFCYSKGQVNGPEDGYVSIGADGIDGLGGQIEITTWNGSVLDYVKLADGVVSNLDSWINKNNLNVTGYEHGAGGWGGYEIIIQKPGTDQFALITYTGGQAALAQKFLKTIRNTFVFTK